MTVLPSISDPAQAAQDLLAAADAIAEHGWTTDQVINSDGRVCALGAIYIGCGWNPHSMLRFSTTSQRVLDAVTALAQVLPETARAQLALNPVTGARTRVFTYNDRVCQGGDELRQKLLEAVIALQPTLGDIGPVRRRVDLEPLEEPLPVTAPAEPAPVKVPEPVK